MRRLIPTILALALAAGSGFAPQGAGAAKGEACDSDTFVFSWVSALGGASLQPYSLGCLLLEPVAAEADANPVDHRLVLPGASAISIRYPNDDVKGTPGFIKGKLDGLGFDAKRILLVRELGATGESYYYDSPIIDLPFAEASSGCLDIVLTHTTIIKKKRANGTIKRIRKVVFKDATTWRTADAIC